MDGGSNLLVFDPAFRLSRDIGKTINCSENGVDFELKSRQARALLKPFRRGRRQLKQHKNFETLVLTEYTPCCQCSAPTVLSRPVSLVCNS
jgi:hypothetical protein